MHWRTKERREREKEAKESISLDLVHEHKVAHRDIKPGNLLISYDGKLKIADFGISQMFATSETMTIANNKHHGTPAFMAPEIFENTASDSEYSGRRADIWSMGVTLFEMWNGDMPFLFPQGTKRRPNHGCLTKFRDGTPESLKSLLNQMLELVPDKRITMDLLKVSLSTDTVF